MKLSIYLSFIFSIVFLTNCNDLDNKIKKEVESLSIDLPSLSSLYIKDIKSDGNINRAEFKVDNLDQKLNELNIQGSARDKLKAIVFASGVTFQGFTLVIENSLGRLINMLGLAKKEKNIISLILLNSNSYGNLISQFNLITEKKCKRIFFFIKKCHNVIKKIPRGFNSNEITIIESSLRFYSYQTFKNLVSNISTSILNTKSNNYKIQEILDPAISYILDQEKDNPYIISISNNIVETFNKILIGEEQQYDNKKIEYILNQHRLEENFKLKILELIDHDIKLVTSDSHKIYRLIYIRENILNYLEIIIHCGESRNLQLMGINSLLELKFEYEEILSLFKFNSQIVYFDLLTNEEYIGELPSVINLIELLVQKKNQLN